MKRILIVAMFLVVMIPTGGSSSSGDRDHYYLRIYPENYKEAIREFHVLGYDIAGVNLEKGIIDVIVSKPEYEQLRGKHALEILRTPDQAAEERVDPLYTDPEELEILMHQYHETFPGITELISIGQTFEGRDIWAIKISDNPLQEEDEPCILFNGQHHAREVMCTEVGLDTIDFLLNNYGSQPEVTQWIDTLEIWIVPNVNLDGTNYMFTQDDYWRKDRHEPPPGSPYYGIDPNRNYSAFWASCDGSSSFPGDDDYHGQYARESNCVDHMSDFEASIRPVFDISYHSYSELVLYPYGCSGTYTPEQDLIASVGQTMAGLIERDNGAMGYIPGTSWQLLYPVDGGDIDYMYSELGTFAYVIELNGETAGFQPPYDIYRDSTVERLRPAWQFLLDRILGPSITGIVRDACTQQPLEGAQTGLEEYPLTGDETPRVTDNFGRYFKVVTPGLYHLEITKPGYHSLSLPVDVGGTQAIHDIELVPEGAFGLSYFDHAVHDESGDQDGILDPGETAGIEVVLRASGSINNITAILSTNDPYVSISDNQADFGTIENGSTGSSLPPHFTVNVAPDCPQQHHVPFHLVFTADQELCVDSSDFTALVTSYEYQCPILEETLDTDPGYEIDNNNSRGWEYGQPVGLPGGGHTGPNCYGTNLDGDYGNNGTYILTSTPFDCSDIYDTELYFWRFLQNEEGYDAAFVEASSDHENWSIVWSGYGWDTTWTEYSYDISVIADGQPQVYIRWKLISDTYVTELGYYIDDISICGSTMPGNHPTPTPQTGFSSDLILNQTMFTEGDTFKLDIEIYNGCPYIQNLHEYLVLDVYGMYFFYPGWTQAIDHEVLELPPGFNETTNILEFTWPGGAGSADGLYFYLGFLDAMTQQLVGTIDMEQFGYQS